MLSKDRETELNELFWNESNDEETQAWRDELTIEEERLVEQWDHDIISGMSSLYKEILDNDTHIVEEKIEDLKKDKYNLVKSVQETENQKETLKNKEVLHEEHYKAFATSKSSDKPTIIYGNSQEEILGKLQAWNKGRTEDNKFVTSNIGTLNSKNNEYENYHKFDMLSGKDITPLYLKLPHLKKAEFTKLTAELKLNGARYNGFSKKWYVTRENDLNKFADYLDFTKESERQPKQMEAEAKAEQKEIFKYFITQKAIDIGTYPLVGEEFPTVTEYEQQQTVKFGDVALQVLGHLEYTQPLSIDQMKEYGLRAADGKEAHQHQEMKYRYGDKSYTKEQMDSINRGIGAKLSPEQIKLYARTELSSAQMEEIRFSILDGLSAEQISKFATVDFKSWQMDFCRIGMQHGVTFQELQPVLAENDKTWTEKRNQLDKMIRDKDIKEKERVPENYLASAEMSAEQNYNSIDGVINNEAPKPEKENKESSKVGSGKKGSIMSKLAENKESIREETNRCKTEPEKGKDGIRLSRE